jgi:formamidopyrimidine-DNA glycosylase
LPELPEAETIRRQLAPHIEGARIVASWARLPRITRPDVETFVARTQGQRIVAARRHGKQLYFPLEDGWNLLVHLGMTGRLQVAPPSAERAGAGADTDRHIHAVLDLDNGQRLVFRDPRTFGALAVEPDLAFLERMGPEPLADDFDEAALARVLRARTSPLKSLLLNQGIVAGLGNIYADEVCFLAGVHPAKRAHRVPLKRLAAVVSHMAPVLRRAIEARGATLKDGGYQDLFGEEGIYHPHVYGRTGEPCTQCGSAIARGVLGAGKSARSYHFCPRCQR